MHEVDVMLLRFDEKVLCYVVLDGTFCQTQVITAPKPITINSTDIQAREQIMLKFILRGMILLVFKHENTFRVHHLPADPPEKTLLLAYSPCDSTPSSQITGRYGPDHRSFY